MRTIRRYILSIIVAGIIAYLSLFRPPKTELDTIPNFDKVVHICMYFGMSGMIWLEYMRSHKGERFRIHVVILLAMLVPILFSVCMELLQAYATTYRSGDPKDVAANSVGVILASLVARYVVKPRWFS
jgi:VanZ family protein